MIRTAVILALLGLVACGADGAPVPLGETSSVTPLTVGVTGQVSE